MKNSDNADFSVLFGAHTPVLPWESMKGENIATCH